MRRVVREVLLAGLGRRRTCKEARDFSVSPSRVVLGSEALNVRYDSEYAIQS